MYVCTVHVLYCNYYHYVYIFHCSYVYIITYHYFYITTHNNNIMCIIIIIIIIVIIMITIIITYREHTCMCFQTNNGIFKKMSVERLGVVVPKTDAALPLWTSTDNLWRRYMKDLL